MSQEFDDFKAKLEAQSLALDGVKTNVAGIATDVAYLKTLTSENPGGLSAEQVAELSGLADQLSAKIDEIGATTAQLDADTDSGAGE